MGAEKMKEVKTKSGASIYCPKKNWHRVEIIASANINGFTVYKCICYDCDIKFRVDEDAIIIKRLI